jgi:hypothetical protein
MQYVDVMRLHKEGETPTGFLLRFTDAILA